MSISLPRSISRTLGLSISDINKIVADAPLRYKVYDIPKRDGVGTRTIAQPARELKSIQRIFLRNYLSDLPVHRSAHAYLRDRGILSNARQHLNAEAILKTDFVSFFNSIIDADWRYYLSELDESYTIGKEYDFTKNVLFWLSKRSGILCLSIGAPSSPHLSNVLMRELDNKIYDMCAEYGLKYTRYADDIIISGQSKDDLLVAKKMLKKIVSSHKRPKLKINERKTGIFTKGMKQMVTGLILTPDGRISLGRERKRAISAGVHRISLGEATQEHIMNIRGWLALANAVEPRFLRRLSRKYPRWVTHLLSLPTTSDVDEYR